MRSQADGHRVRRTRTTCHGQAVLGRDERAERLGDGFSGRQAIEHGDVLLGADLACQRLDLLDLAVQILQLHGERRTVPNKAGGQRKNARDHLPPGIIRHLLIKEAEAIIDLDLLAFLAPFAHLGNDQHVRFELSAGREPMELPILLRLNAHVQERQGDLFLDRLGERGIGRDFRGQLVLRLPFGVARRRTGNGVSGVVIGRHSGVIQGSTPVGIPSVGRLGIVGCAQKEPPNTITRTG